MKTRRFIETAKPRLNTGSRAKGEKAPIHDHVAREKDVVAFDKDERVAARMSSAVPEQTHADSAQVESLFRLENFVGTAKYCILHQLRHRWGSRGEIRLHPELLDILLLRPSADDFRTRWKCRFAQDVFGVKMGSHDIQVRVAADFADFSKYGLAVPWTEPG